MTHSGKDTDMPVSLTTDQRNLPSRVTLEAGEVAENAARAALENLAAHEGDYRGHMTVEQRQLRNRLRARGRALGDRLDQRWFFQSRPSSLRAAFICGSPALHPNAPGELVGIRGPPPDVAFVPHPFPPRATPMLDHGGFGESTTRLLRVN
jgi:hypothetical protein